MHNYIFQIWTEPIVKEDWLTEDVCFGESTCCNIDYTSNITLKERNQAIKSFISYLPSYCFKCESKDVIVYRGGVSIWLDSIMERIQHCLNNYTNPEEQWSQLYNIQNIVENPLGHRDLICWDNQDPEKSSVLLDNIKSLQAGDKLYIGGVVDYHW